jgi:hypothetical protein
MSTLLHAVHPAPRIIAFVSGSIRKDDLMTHRCTRDDSSEQQLNANKEEKGRREERW